jgi:hypothetical protein
VSAVTVELLSSPSAGAQKTGSDQVVQTDSSNQYVFPSVASGDWQIQPSKLGDQGAGISALDAVYILQAIAGTRTLTPEQVLACDTTGNGTLSPLDAVRILQLKTGLITRLDVAQTCNSDWAFIPVPAGQIPPHMTTGSCQAGTIDLPALSGPASNQDFSAVLFGDCTGNWQPGTTTPATSARRQERSSESGAAAAVSVGRAHRRGSHIRVPLVVGGLRSFSGLDAEIRYDPTHVLFRGVRRIERTAQALLATNGREPGVVVVSLASLDPLPAGTVAVLLFDEPSDDFGASTIHVTHGTVASE